MNLFMVTGTGIPMMFFKAATRDDVIERLHIGMDNETMKEVTSQRDFRIKQIQNMEELMKAIPYDEFSIIADTSF